MACDRADIKNPDGFAMDRKVRKELSMNAQSKDEGAVSRLTELSDKLAEIYPEAGNRVAQAIKPINEAIGKIGLCYREDHWAEDAVRCIRRNLDTRSAGRPSSFLTEEQDGDSSIEYALCAARVSGRCRLAISVCRYRELTKKHEEEDGRSWTDDIVELENVDTILPDELPECDLEDYCNCP